jgi:hypothetical protein
LLVLGYLFSDCTLPLNMLTMSPLAYLRLIVLGCPWLQAEMLSVEPQLQVRVHSSKILCQYTTSRFVSPHHALRSTISVQSLQVLLLLLPLQLARLRSRPPR